MRGNRVGALPALRCAGSIPAYAGEPSPSTPGARTTTVYPRVCGGTPPGACLREQNMGLSPRMRGNPANPRLPPARERSIPAYAGEPTMPSICGATISVYPRVCGGTVAVRQAGGGDVGLSPRMRGNHPETLAAIKLAGSIPAYAGEPYPGRTASSRPEVYPRVCGGTLFLLIGQDGNVGLSPRMRGNQAADWDTHRQAGSIPAYAGEPGV